VSAVLSVLSVADASGSGGGTVGSPSAPALPPAGRLTGPSPPPVRIMALLDEYAVEPAAPHAVVIDRSPILGKPAGMRLLARSATVSYCLSPTVDLPAGVATADIVVAAVRRPALVGGAWLKPGAVVVDAGDNQGNVGDVAGNDAMEWPT
jgi:methylenetetrahydrofolate dehydrogenase (NADP+)/methenyltetrahydrofolate cyclohydrolase